MKNSIVLVVCTGILVLVIPASSFSGEDSWTRSGPEGGEVRSIAMHPTDPFSVLVGTIDGIYRSSDGGATWSRPGDGNESRTIFDLIINPDNPNEVFALAWKEGGLLASTDGGASWSALEFGLDRDIRTLRHSSSPFELYVVDEGELFVSSDSGETWVQIASDAGSFEEFEVYPGQAAAMIAYLEGDGLVTSDDGGTTWTACGSTPSDSWGDMAFDWSSLDTIYTPGKGVLYRSFDRCDSWDSVDAPDLDTYSSVVVDPFRRATFYAEVDDGFVVSTDWGSSWARFGPDIEPLHSYEIAVSSSHPGLVHVSAMAMDDRRGVFRTDDGGASWTFGKEELCISSVGQLAGDLESPSTVYAGAKRFGRYDGDGLFKSEDSGQTWAFLDGTEGAGPVVAVDPLAPRTLYTASADWGILKSVDAGGAWNQVWQGFNGRRIEDLDVDPHYAGRLYAAVDSSDYSAYRSDDGGASWSLMDMPEASDFWQIYLHPLIPDLVFAASWEGLYRSFDGGENWEFTASGLETSPECPDWGCGWYHHVADLDFDPKDPTLIYASTKAGPFRSMDFGSSWLSARDGMFICCSLRVWNNECSAAFKTSGPLTCEGWPLSLEIDPARPATLYTTTSLGTYRSFNRGVTWERLTDSDEPIVKSIQALGSGRLVGATDTAGVLSLETDYAPTPRRGLRRVPAQDPAKNEPGIEIRK